MLLEQVDGAETAVTPPPVYRPAEMIGGKGRMLRVRVIIIEGGNPKPTNVNVNLPLKAAHSLVRLVQTVMPNQARDAMAAEGIDLSAMDLEGLIESLAETGGDIVNVTHEDEEDQVMVRVYVD